MKNSTKIIIAVVAVIAIAAVVIAIILMNSKSKPKTSLPEINSAEDLVALVDKVYEGQEDKVPSSVTTQIIDTSDDAMVQVVTGLESGKDLEYVVSSEPMITSQAYSFVLVKVKDGVNADEIAKSMKDKINTSKWICVSAEKLYATSSGNIVCLVMSSEEMAKPVYESFKTLAGTVGQEYEKSEEEIELPPEMF